MSKRAGRQASSSRTKKPKVMKNLSPMSDYDVNGNNDDADDEKAGKEHSNCTNPNCTVPSCLQFQQRIPRPGGKSDKNGNNNNNNNNASTNRKTAGNGAGNQSPDRDDVEQSPDLQIYSCRCGAAMTGVEAFIQHVQANQCNPAAKKTSATKEDAAAGDGPTPKKKDRRDAGADNTDDDIQVIMSKTFEEAVAELRNLAPTLGSKTKSNVERKRDALQLCKDQHVFIMEKAKPGGKKKEDVWKELMTTFVSDRYTGRSADNPNTHEAFKCTSYQHFQKLVTDMVNIWGRLKNWEGERARTGVRVAIEAAAETDSALGELLSVLNEVYLEKKDYESASLHQRQQQQQKKEDTRAGGSAAKAALMSHSQHERNEAKREGGRNQRAIDKRKDKKTGTTSAALAKRKRKMGGLDSIAEGFCKEARSRKVVSDNKTKVAIIQERAKLFRKLSKGGTSIHDAVEMIDAICGKLPANTRNDDNNDDDNDGGDGGGDDSRVLDDADDDDSGDDEDDDDDDEDDDDE